MALQRQVGAAQIEQWEWESPFTSEVMLPAQFRDLMRASCNRPEHALLYELIRSAIDDVVFHGRNAFANGNGKSPTRDAAYRRAKWDDAFQNAVAWLTDLDARQVCSFRYCCEHLGLDADMIATAVRRHVAHEQAMPCERRGRVARNGRKQRSFSPTERIVLKRRIRHLQQQGHCIEQIARRLGVAGETVRRASEGVGPWGGCV